MRSEINIVQGKAKIVLHAESEFERDFIEKIVDSKIGYEAITEVLSRKSIYHDHSLHRIEIHLSEKQEEI